MKNILFLIHLPLSLTFWCQTYVSEYTNGFADCLSCTSNSDCDEGRECWNQAWCKIDILCGSSEFDECREIEDPYLFSFPSPPFPLYLSSPPMNSHNNNIILKYFKEIGIPLILGILGIIGSIIGRIAIKRCTKTRQKKTKKINDVLNEDSSEGTEGTEGTVQSPNQVIELERV